MPVCASSGVYVPRDTHGCDAAVLVRHHLAGFLERIEEGSHAPLPDLLRGWRSQRLLEARGAEPGAGPVPEPWLIEIKDRIAPPLGAEEVVGTMPNIPANRINRQLDLGGPSWTVAAGEASGRVALELGARALARGELDTALVGAVDQSALAAIEGGEGPPPGDAAVVLARGRRRSSALNRTSRREARQGR